METLSRKKRHPAAQHAVGVRVERSRPGKAFVLKWNAAVIRLVAASCRYTQRCVDLFGRTSRKYNFLTRPNFGKSRA